ncbi:unnamed protein product [Prorocentrum cordatum]|uniref:Nuclear pore complex protein Nup85 n=1 Tax=Prorocentrum cordatum TaxID=2364126 RepID=A0ABN9WXR1_9DINO|nr:unnamed protein product [Polarella glacialis]
MPSALPHAKAYPLIPGLISEAAADHMHSIDLFPMPLLLSGEGPSVVRNYEGGMDIPSDEAISTGNMGLRDGVEGARVTVELVSELQVLAQQHSPSLRSQSTEPPAGGTMESWAAFLAPINDMEYSSICTTHAFLSSSFCRLYTCLRGMADVDFISKKEARDSLIEWLHHLEDTDGEPFELNAKAQDEILGTVVDGSKEQAHIRCHAWRALLLAASAPLAAGVPRGAGRGAFLAKNRTGGPDGGKTGLGGAVALLEELEELVSRRERAMARTSWLLAGVAAAAAGSAVVGTASLGRAAARKVD